MLGLTILFVDQLYTLRNALFFIQCFFHSLFFFCFSELSQNSMEIFMVGRPKMDVLKCTTKGDLEAKAGIPVGE